MSDRPPRFRLDEARRQLLEQMLAEEAQPSLAAQEATGRPGISRRAATEPALPSFAQARLWFLDHLMGGTPAYNIPFALQLSGPLEVGLLERSLNFVLQRHPALFSTFPAQEGQPTLVLRPFQLKLEVESLPDGQQGSTQEALEQLAIAEGRRPFDLAQGPLLRGRLWQLAPQEHLLLLTIHHIVFDEWSTGIFFQELAQVYAALQRGEAPVLPDLPIEFADFAAWQREELQRGAWQAQLDYWRELLAGAPEALDLPADRPRPPVQSLRGACVMKKIPEGLSQQVHLRAREWQITPSALLTAAFAAFLQRLSDQDDFCLGIPAANRQHPEAVQVIGFFLNTLVLRLRPDRQAPFFTLLAQVQKALISALAHQDLPFDRLVDELRPQRDLSRQPLFQVMFVYGQENLPPSLGPVRLTPWHLDYGWAKFDLTLYLMETAEGLRARLEYATDLFHAETAAHWLEAFLQLLSGLLAEPERPVEEIALLSPAERQRLVEAWNDTAAPYPAESCLHDLFESQASRTPQAPALVYGEQVLSYQSLNAAAELLAEALRRLGVGAESRVGLFFERSLEQMVTLLGVLKAGGAAVPLDPAYPPQRLRHILQLAQPHLLLSHASLSQQLPDWDGGLGLCAADGNLTWVQPMPLKADQQLEGREAATPDSLAYILYTSGSTGVPKGVAMPHRPLVNLMRWQVQRSAPLHIQRTLQFASLNFDVSFQEIFSTWSSGGCLYLIAEDLRREAGRLLDWLRENAIERLFLPFVALQSLAEAAQTAAELPTSLREIITAGEQLRIDDTLRRFFARLPGCRLDNQYGPTEAHVVSAYLLEGEPDNWPDLPPIGRPIANARLYVLDRRLQPQPIGVPGELYIGGLSLARGYLQAPELTAERFLPSPFVAGERLYRTGDLARFLPDGNLMFLGRRDTQVKVRGYRVEMGEIEVLLSQHPAISQAVVIAQQDESGSAGTRLLAYVTVRPGAEVTSAALRWHLQQSLPDYMIPAEIIFLEAFPLTPSGKVDRRRLPLPERRGGEAEVTPPRDELESWLCQVWQEVLGLQRVGIQDSFFDLGGHSLLALRLFARLEQRLGRRLPVTLLFQYQTIAQLAEYLRREQEHPAWSELVPIHLPASASQRPPFFMVHTFGGGVLTYAPVIRAMGQDLPVYGLEARGLDGVTPPHTSIPEMAAAYVQAIRRLQPHGPYYLGGYCFGGVVAYEMACQLQQLGERTAFLAIIDGYAPAQTQTAVPFVTRWVNLLRNLPFWLRDFLRLGRKNMWVNIRRRLRMIAAGLQAKVARRLKLHRQTAGLQMAAAGESASEEAGSASSVAPGTLTAAELIRDHVAEAPEFHQRLMSLHMQALMDYQPPPYEGKVTLLRVRTMPLFQFYTPDGGWSRLARQGVSVHLVPGSHHNVLEEPYAQSLGQELRRLLDQHLTG